MILDNSKSYHSFHIASMRQRLHSPVIWDKQYKYSFHDICYTRAMLTPSALPKRVSMGIIAFNKSKKKNDMYLLHLILDNQIIKSVSFITI